MDADGELVQTDALVTGQSFALVQPDDDNPMGVEITAESPFEATVLYRAGDRRERIAGYKRFAGDAMEYPWPAWMGVPAAGQTEVLMTPDLIATWPPGAAGPEIAPNPAGLVGMIEIVPQPRTWGPPRTELTPAMSIQDRINTTIFNRMVASDYGAFRQIWATGVKIPRTVTQVTGEDGTTQENVAFQRPYDVGANRLLANENPAARFGSFAESTLQGYLASVEQDVSQLAAITQTPPHYVLGQMVNLSADAIKAAEAGLVAKVSRRALHIGEGWMASTSARLLRIIGTPPRRQRLRGGSGRFRDPQRSAARRRAGQNANPRRPDRGPLGTLGREPARDRAMAHPARAGGARRAARPAAATRPRIGAVQGAGA